MVLRPQRPYMESSLPLEYQALADRIGEGNAWVVYKMERKLAALGLVAQSTAELLVYDWLEREQVPFEYQVPIQLVSGLRRLDFVVFTLPQGAMVWRVQGVYWHGDESTESEDQADRRLLLASETMGRPIAKVIDLIDDHIYKSRDRLLADAVEGIQWHGID